MRPTPNGRAPWRRSPPATRRRRQARLEKLVGGELGLDAAVGLGVITEATGDTAAAADWYRKALAIDPNNMTAKLGLGRVALPAASPVPPPGSN